MRNIIPVLILFMVGSLESQAAYPKMACTNHYLQLRTQPKLRNRELTGHGAEITSVDFSPNRRILASGGADDKVILWNALTGEKIRTLDGHTRQVEDITFSPDG